MKITSFLVVLWGILVYNTSIYWWSEFRIFDVIISLSTLLEVKLNRDYGQLVSLAYHICLTKLRKE